MVATARDEAAPLMGRDQEQGFLRSLLAEEARREVVSTGAASQPFGVALSGAGRPVAGAFMGVRRNAGRDSGNKRCRW